MKVTSEHKKLIYLAIKYINDNPHHKWYPYPQTIASFLKGTENSPFYDTFRLYIDCFGKMPNCNKNLVIKVADELSAEDLLYSTNGRYFVKNELKENIDQIKIESSIKEAKVIDISLTKSIETKTNQRFSELLTVKQKENVKKIDHTLREYDPKIKVFEQKFFIGYRYEPVEGKENPYWFRIRKNNKGKIEFVLRNKPTSKQEDAILLTDKNMTEIARRLEIVFSKSVDNIEEIRKRIREKDYFEEFNYKNSETITPMPHQKAGMYLSNLYEKFAFFYDTGTGKTIMTLEVIFEKLKKDNSRFLIIAPKPLIKSAWMEDAANYPNMKILPLSTDIKNIDYAHIYNSWNEIDGKEDRISVDDLTGRIIKKVDMDAIKEELIDRAHHFIINIDRIREPKKSKELLDRIRVNGLVVDESSILKNYESGNSRRVRVLAKQMKYVYLLSGKPAPNGIHEFYSQMVIVAPKAFNLNYSKFISEYFAKSGKFGKIEPKNDKAKRDISRMVASASITVSKKDCIVLPYQTSRYLEVQLEDDAMEMYGNVFRNFVTEITSIDGKSTQTKRMPNIAKIAKLREIASGIYLDDKGLYHVSQAKMKVLKNLVRRLGDVQILIWCNFIFEIELIEKELSNMGYKVGTAYGKTKDIYETLKAFKENRTQILIAHPKTLKYGVTLVNCHNAIFNSMSYSFEDYYQAHDRIYRIGQKNSCTFYHLISKYTIDEAIASRIKDKSLNSSVFEELIKMSSRFNVSEEGVEKLKKLSQRAIAFAEDELNVSE